MLSLDITNVMGQRHLNVSLKYETEQIGHTTGTCSTLFRGNSPNPLFLKATLNYSARNQNNKTVFQEELR